MSQYIPVPVPQPVVYTLEHVSTVPVDEWHAFVLAVTEAFWQLPGTLRPASQDRQFATMLRASELFPEPFMLAFCGERADPVCLTVERERNRNTLSLQELDFRQQPGDFFARVVMVLLHNLCPGHFRVHSTAGYASWRLPHLWAERHLNLMLDVPQPPVSLSRPASLPGMDNATEGAVLWLMLALLSGPERGLTRSEWALIAETEHRLLSPETVSR